MNKNNIITIFCIMFFFLGCAILSDGTPVTLVFAKETKFLKGGNLNLPGSIKLTEPKRTGKVSVEEALSKRRSAREYGKGSLSMEEVSQLLWSAQGINNERGDRTAPSAGALYPLEIYLVIGEVKGINPGIYHYNPEKNNITLKTEGDLREKLAVVSLHQNSITKAPAVLVIAAVYERTTKKYGERGVKYVHMEVGCAAENIYLQCESLGLATVFIGAFEDAKVKKILGIKEEPLAIMPVGKNGSVK